MITQLLYLDGVYAEDAYGKIRFHRIKVPTADELQVLAHRVSQRVAKLLGRRGFLERDAEHSYLALETAEEQPMHQLYGHSITYRIAIEPRKVFTLQSLPPIEEPKAGLSRVAKVAGFRLHAGMVAQAHQRDKLERLCRYIAHPARVWPPATLPIPSYSPQLNLMERFWKLLRRRATHNRLFESMAQLRAALRHSICYYRTMRQRILSLIDSPRKAAKLAAA